MNSLIHGFRDAKAGEIRLDMTPEARRVTIWYHDNGRGMTPAEKQQAFEPFFTTTRGHGGTGLGLQIVYNLVTQKLTGDIRCQSAPGEGTAFCLELPIENEIRANIHDRNED